MTVIIPHGLEGQLIEHHLFSLHEHKIHNWVAKRLETMPRKEGSQ